MGLTAAALYALVSVAGADKAVGDLGRVSSAVNRAHGVMSGVGKGAGQMAKGVSQVGAGLFRVATIAAAAATTLGVAAAKIGVDFQAQMELIHTQAGATQAEVLAQTKAVQDLVHQVGTAPVDLAKGLYHIESAGVRGAAAIDILRASALGAKTGLADMESVSNALVAVWFSGIGGAKNMTSAMATLNAIVGVGNMRMQDLVASFGSGILGTAKTFGVGLRELGSALAVLTDAGVPAEVAATRLSMTFSHLAAPNAAALKIFKKLSLDQFALAKDLRKPDGIFVAFQDLHDHLAALGEIKGGKLTPQGTADVTKIFGGSRFGATAMQLLAQMDRIKTKYDAIGASQKTFGEKVQETMATAGFKFGQLKADIEESALAFSSGLLPALGRATSKFDTFLVGHHADFVTLGTDIGTFIDKIDWKQVEDGANTFVGILKTVASILEKVPVQVDAAAAAFLGLNKLSGGLIGQGLENIAGGGVGILGALTRGALSKVPKVGGVLGQIGATPVYITGIAPGVNLGGPLGGGPVAPGGPGGSGFLGKLGTIVGGAMLVSIVGSVAVDWSGINDPSHKTPEGTTFRGSNDIATNIANQQRSIAMLTERANAGDAFAAKQLAAAQKVLADLQAAQAAGYTNMFDWQKAKGNIAGAPPTAPGWDTQSEQDRMARTAANAAALAAAETAKTAVARQVTDGRTNLHRVLAAIEKASAARYGGHGLGPAAVHATLLRDLIRHAKDTVKSSLATGVKIERLKELEAIAVAGKDWGVARTIGADIRNMKIQAGTAQFNIDGRKMASALMPFFPSTYAGDRRA